MAYNWLGYFTKFLKLALTTDWLRENWKIKRHRLQISDEIMKAKNILNL